MMSWNITLVIGVVFVATAGFFAAREHLWLTKARIAQGTVVEMIASRGSKGTTYKPRVSFKGNDGSTHEFVRGYSSNPPEFRVGDEVMVAYQGPEYEGRILTFGQRFGFPTILASIGLFLILMSAAFLVGRQFVPRIYIEQTDQGWR